MKSCTVWVDGPWIKIRAPYDKNLTPHCNNDLKDRLPHGTRRWDPDEKVWKVDPSHDATLMEILERWFDEVNVLEQHAPPVPAAAITSGSDLFSQMLKLCPDTALPKVYRVIAASVHPDAPGGDAEKMKQLNSLWSQIKQERGL